VTRGPRAAALLVAVAATLASAPSVPAADGGAAPPAPTVMDLAAIKRALKGSHARVTVVHFWATWCFPCLEELPLVDKFAREAKSRGVDVLSLSLDDPEQGRARVAKVLSQSAPTLTRAIARVDDADSFIGNFGSWEGSIPALFAFDAGGQLRGELIGETSRRALDDLVGKVLKAKERPAH
jgi:thiol-disulfide isomerase/thioredoxin